jgi:hypothetical protein
VLQIKSTQVEFYQIFIVHTNAFFEIRFKERNKRSRYRTNIIKKVVFAKLKNFFAKLFFSRQIFFFLLRKNSLLQNTKKKVLAGKKQLSKKVF